jgi:hypothetical protein
MPAIGCSAWTSVPLVRRAEIIGRILRMAGVAVIRMAARPLGALVTYVNVSFEPSRTIVSSDQCLAVILSVGNPSSVGRGNTGRAQRCLSYRARPLMLSRLSR